MLHIMYPNDSVMLMDSIELSKCILHLCASRITFPPEVIYLFRCCISICVILSTLMGFMCVFSCVHDWVCVCVCVAVKQGPDAPEISEGEAWKYWRQKSMTVDLRVHERCVNVFDCRPVSESNNLSKNYHGNILINIILSKPALKPFKQIHYLVKLTLLLLIQSFT